VIEMGCGKNDTGLPHPGYFLDVGPASGTTTAIAPGLTSGIEPASIWQNAYDLAMGPSASLANAAGTLEAHMSAELRSVDRIEPAHLSPDRHHRLRSPRRQLVCQNPFEIKNGQSQVLGYRPQ
jgi:hypothetical protein